jgi:hypothetical protein
MVTAFTYRRKLLNKRITEFVRDVIRSRSTSMARKPAPSEKAKCQRIIGELRQANALNYTEKGAAVYFINAADDILFLILPNDREKMNRFRELLEASKLFSKL